MKNELAGLGNGEDQKAERIGDTEDRNFEMAQVEEKNQDYKKTNVRKK